MMDSRLLPRGLKTAIDLIQRDFARPWTVPQLASASGVARRTLQTQFRRFIGASPLQFLRETRLAEARRQFVRAEPTTTVTSAAIVLGAGLAWGGRVLPMELKLGDRLTDEAGEYEVICHSRASCSCHCDALVRSSTMYKSP
jgi:helix-turn-helix protein